MSFRICSYYTIDTPYQEVAHDYLMNSLRRMNNGIKSDVRGVPSLGSWQKNTSYKAQFVSTMLEHYTDNIVFLDCDAEILRYPDLFDSIPEGYNFACHILDRNRWYGMKFDEHNSKELLSGTLFVRNNKESRIIIKEWELTCRLSPQIWEQQILGMVLKKNNIPIYELPISYCYIKTLPDGREPLVKCESPVITHNQVSRRLRNKL